MKESERVNGKAVVLLSGGMDSSICLCLAIEEFGRENVYPLCFTYGQKHQEQEVLAAIQVAYNLEVLDKLITYEIPFFRKLDDSALLNSKRSVKEKRVGTELPDSFVPGRNIIFLTVAGAYAYKKGAHYIVGGMSQEDYSGYPDCRRIFIDYLQQALNLGMDYEFEILTPLMFISKVEEIKLAQTTPDAMKALSWSYTCYEGKVIPCGECPACKLRIKAFQEAGINDPYLERIKNGR